MSTQKGMSKAKNVRNSLKTVSRHLTIPKTGIYNVSIEIVKDVDGDSICFIKSHSESGMV